MIKFPKIYEKIIPNTGTANATDQICFAKISLHHLPFLAVVFVEALVFFRALPPVGNGPERGRNYKFGGIFSLAAIFRVRPCFCFRIPTNDKRLSLSFST